MCLYSDRAAIGGYMELAERVAGEINRQYRRMGRPYPWCYVLRVHAQQEGLEAHELVCGIALRAIARFTGLRPLGGFLNFGHRHIVTPRARLMVGRYGDTPMGIELPEDFLDPVVASDDPNGAYLRSLQGRFRFYDARGRAVRRITEME